MTTPLGGMARSNRVGRLRGYGNALDVRQASAFIGAYMRI